MQSNSTSPDSEELDAVLLARVRDGRRDALQQLHQRHAASVYALARYILRDDGEAEELTQEIFLTVWNKAELYQESKAHFRTWLLSITRNRAIDQLRQRHRRIQADVSLDDNTLAQNRDPATQTQDSQRELHLLLRHLPAEQRSVIELSYFQGYTHEEIAAALDVPLGTVKSRVLLGIKKLRAMLREE